ncbi:hypothetical protein J2X19_002092 [Rhodoferax ferrireducens]|uniref:Uncharacterized protein n=1 Tax=Rhodoferax ferrireducens TaxID=192843 RepID=A0ABU2C7V1_9BURK|nr:hypothetical protein [Rhodoferax ferrireducens]MDR7377413.1 hypothetical protein [Rhodoferax ferrireducens]
MKFLQTKAIWLGLLFLNVVLTTQSTFASDAGFPALDAPLPAMGTEWRWVIQGDGAVSVHGSVGRDGSTGAVHPMMYPAPDAVSFIAAILTHAVINSGIRSAEQEKRLKEADIVLQPLHQALVNLTTQQLSVDVARRSALLADHQMHPLATTEWLAEITPSYLVSSDLRSLSLDADIVIWPAKKGKVPAAIRKIRVLSDPLEKDSGLQHWTDNDGEALQRVATGLLVEAIELAMQTWSAPDPGSQRTLRFRDGAYVRTERAQLLQTQCGRLHARNLRGWLISLPAVTSITNEEKDNACEIWGTRFR